MSDQQTHPQTQPTPGDTPTADALPIACNPNAIPAEQREQWIATGIRLYQAVEEVRELPDGYAFRLPATSEMLTLAVEDIAYERLCCPFLRFTLEVTPGEGPLWFRLTGSQGAKAYLKMAFESANLLDAELASAAGLHITAPAEIDSPEKVAETIQQVNERFAETGSSA